MNPIFAPYNSLSTMLQAIHQSNINLYESFFLVKIRSAIYRYLKLLDRFSGIGFLSTEHEEENNQLQQDVEVLQLELKEKDAIFALLEEEYLKTQEKTKNFQVAVHEVKTPLTSIIGFSELLLRDKEQFNETQRDILQRILNAGQKQLEVIDKMLNRVSKTASVKKEPCSLKNLVADLQANIEVLAKKKGVKLYIQMDSDVPQEIATDRFKLDSILTNLLSNAVKYTDEGSIDLKVTRPESQQLVFRIVDTGRGIPKDEQDHIFSLFERGSNIRKEGGMGIGLALCREMVELLGGSLKVHSDGDGKGSTFILELPIED